MCNCNSNKKQEGCKYITVQLLQEQKNIYQSVIDNNWYSLVNMTNEYILKQINKINQSIQDKINNPDSCKYSSSQNIFNSDIQYIITHTQ